MSQSTQAELTQGSNKEATTECQLTVTCALHPSIQVSHTIHHTGSHRHLRRTRQDVQRSWSSEDAGFIKTSMKKPSIAPKKNATSTISTLKQPRALSPSSCSLVKGQRSLLYCKLPSTKSAQEGIVYYPSRHVSCERPLIDFLIRSS